jgi:hypothetical protein
VVWGRGIVASSRKPSSARLTRLRLDTHHAPTSHMVNGPERKGSDMRALIDRNEGNLYLIINELRFLPKFSSTTFFYRFALPPKRIIQHLPLYRFGLLFYFFLSRTIRSPFLAFLKQKARRRSGLYMWIGVFGLLN